MIKPLETLHLLFPNLVNCSNPDCAKNSQLLHIKSTLKSNRIISSIKDCYICSIKFKTIPNEMRQFVLSNQDLFELISYRVNKTPSYQLVDLRNQKGNIIKNSCTIQNCDPSKIIILMDEDGNDYSKILANFDRFTGVCAIEGGFKSLHDLIINLKLVQVIESHRVQSCGYCLKEKSIYNPIYLFKEEDGLWDVIVKVFKGEEIDCDSNKSSNRAAKTPRQQAHDINSTKENRKQKQNETQSFTTQTSLNNAFSSPKSQTKDQSQPVSLGQSILKDRQQYIRNDNNSQPRKMNSTNKTEIFNQHPQKLDIIVPMKKQINPNDTIANKILVFQQPRSIHKNLEIEDQRSYQLNIASNRSQMVQLSPARSFLPKNPKFSVQNYEKNGIFNSHLIEFDQILVFLNSFKDNQFKVFTCSLLNEKGEQKQRILVMTQGEIVFQNKCINRIRDTFEEFLVHFQHSDCIAEYQGVALCRNKSQAELNLQLSDVRSEQAKCEAGSRENKAKIIFSNVLFEEDQQQKTEHLHALLLLPIACLCIDVIMHDQINDKNLYTSSFFKMIKSINGQTFSEIKSQKKIQQFYNDAALMERIEIKMTITLERLQDVQSCIEIGKNFYKELLDVLQGDQNSQQNSFSK